MTIFPDHFTAGLTFDKIVISTCYPSPDWQLVAHLRGPLSINISAQPFDTSHRFLVSAATTANWAAGNYWYTIRASKDGEVFEVESGEIAIKQDMSQAEDSFDGRSHVQKVLEAIEAVLEKRATLDQERYRINNRELYRTSIPDLLLLRDRYRAELRRQKALANGGGGLLGTTARVRFR